MKFKLTNQALETLRQMAAAPGWSKDAMHAVAVKMAYLGCKLVGEILPDTEPAPEAIDENTPAHLAAKSAREFKEWAKRKAKEFELDDNLIEACRRAIRHAINTGNNLHNMATGELFDAFGIVPPDVQIAPPPAALPAPAAPVAAIPPVASPVTAPAATS